ncbi:MAG: hypothetical protein Q8L51_02550, partial [Candidatus Amesbacteria bacterium]|nr:hypothetical protein [Candidatus Amesbacteria bacterium]
IPEIIKIEDPPIGWSEPLKILLVIGGLGALSALIFKGAQKLSAHERRIIQVTTSTKQIVTIFDTPITRSIHQDLRVRSLIRNWETNSEPEIGRILANNLSPEVIIVAPIINPGMSPLRVDQANFSAIQASRMPADEKEAKIRGLYEQYITEHVKRDTAF